MIKHSPLQDSMRIRVDGWENLYNGYGISTRDSNVHTTFSKNAKKTEQEYRDLYEGDAFAKRIVDLPINDMVREGFEIEGDTDGEVLSEMKRIQGVFKLVRLMRWGSVFGGAIGVVGLDDGQDLDKRLNENNLKSVNFVHVFDRYRVNWTNDDLYKDPNEQEYGKVEYYTISPLVGSPFVVHSSRTIVFEGVDISDYTRRENNGWGDSIYKSVYDYVRRLTNVYGDTEHVVKGFVETMLQIDGLADLIAAGKEDLILQRLQILDMGRHIMNTVLTDTNETFEKKTANVTGLDKLIDKFQMSMSSVTGIPVTVLFGRSAAGENATGDADFKIWYDKVAALQRSDYSSILEPLVRWIMLAKEGPFKGKEIDGWSIKYMPLWQPSQKEVAETRKLVAETDEIYINSGTVAPDEIRESRFGGDDYSMETDIEGDIAPLNEPEEPEMPDNPDEEDV